MDLANLVAALDFSTLPQQLVNGILLGAIYALIALGYTRVYGVLRLINFAHGEVFMLGAYVSLFVSYAMGFGPGSTRDSTWINLVIMLLSSMLVCGIVGVLIELFAYRPMRSQARIASLITAIGVSLLLQYGGALILPNSPPPSINERVNPIQGTLEMSLVGPDAGLLKQADEAKIAFTQAEDRYKAQSALDPKAEQASTKGLRDEKNAADRTYNNLQRRLDNSGVRLRVPWGQVIILGTTIVLMLMLTYLVLYTSVGRAMRAVSHDFDSASLMGVNVNRIVTFTFLIGSMLAGAGAMMNATFIGTPLTTFYGLQPGVKAFVAAVLGGIGNIPGAVLGGLLMGVAETTVVWLGYSSYRDAIAFIILIVVLLFRPGGLMGSNKVEKV